MRTSRILTAAWIGLLLLAGLYLFGAANDLLADARTGLPTDHTGTFTAVTGTTWSRTAPTAGYITLLERGYALHELVFALLFVVLLAVPFRRRNRWAWYACWTPTIANLGYALTFGAHDPAVGYRALVALIALPVLLLMHVPAFFARPGQPRG
ncbi:MAG TPA: hypothetical protein VJT31_25015 [Rugosimonospora sp.]|nr:hypothetical protein [Rugosimonospora sp.]